MAARPLSLYDFDKIPSCWDWNSKTIIQYVNERRKIARLALRKEGYLDAELNTLVDNVLIHCLNMRNHAENQAGEQLFVYVPFHRCKEVPISDVFTALGWFISYAEEVRSDPSQLGHLLVLYTRLCLNISSEISRTINLNSKMKRAFTPKKTHILFEARHGVQSLVPQQMNDILLSLSSSAPGQIVISNDKARSMDHSFRNNTRTQRVEALKTHTGRSAIELDEFVRRGDPGQDGWFDLGNCAETLTYASLYSSTDQIHAYGAALDIAKLTGPFTSFAEYLTKAHKDPCTHCQHMFWSGKVTQYDIHSGKVDGPIPDGYVLTEKAAQRTGYACSYCNAGTKAAAVIPCEGCGGRIVWCSETCQTSDRNHVHRPTSVPHTNQAYTPVIPGRARSGSPSRAEEHQHQAQTRSHGGS